MSVRISPQRKFTFVPFEATLLFAVPALIALICALALRDGAWFSGVWFIYSASRDIALVGVLLSLVVTVSVWRTASEKLIFLLAASTIGAMVLLWYAIYLEPYFR